MPNLVNSDISTAETEMNEFVMNGIKVTYLPSDKPADVGVITDQSIEAGTQVPVNFDGEIIIHVGTGKSSEDTPGISDGPITVV